MMTRRSSMVGAVMVAVLGLALTACGNDDGDDASADPDDTAVEAGTEENGDDAPSGGDCGDTDLTFTYAETGEVLELTSTAAVSLEGGRAYTAYGADFEIEPDDISLFASPEVPADGNLVTLAVTVFNAEEELDPLEPGQVVTHGSSEFGILTFVVTGNQGEELFGNNSGGEGELTITAVGDRFCVEVDYRDDEKSLSGTLAADVKDL